MTADDAPRPVPQDDEFWREFLTTGDPRERAKRWFYKRIPHGPRCRMCAAPFEGIGAPAMRLIGKRRSDINPTMCSSCSDFIGTHHGGAEIEATFLFADVRGSTTLAEEMAPADFRALMDRFYTASTQVVYANDGGIDKFVGDELMAMFFPLLSAEHHAADAVRSAQELLRATGHADPAGPWIPLGAGVHTGLAWVGAVGVGARTDLTALGDTVNTAARLASAAAAGEILVTAEAAAASGLETAGLERRQLLLKGKQSPTDVISLRIAPERVDAGSGAKVP